jgi:hypothetical protein
MTDAGIRVNQGREMTEKHVKRALLKDRHAKDGDSQAKVSRVGLRQRRNQIMTKLLRMVDGIDWRNMARLSTRPPSSLATPSHSPSLRRTGLRVSRQSTHPPRLKMTKKGENDRRKLCRAISLEIAPASATCPALAMPPSPSNRMHRLCKRLTVTRAEGCRSYRAEIFFFTRFFEFAKWTQTRTKTKKKKEKEKEKKRKRNEAE